MFIAMEECVTQSQLSGSIAAWLVGPPPCSRLKYPNHYWMDFHEFGTKSYFSSSAIIKYLNLSDTLGMTKNLKN